MMPGGLLIHFMLSNIFLLIFLFPISFILVEPVEEDPGNTEYHHHDSHYQAACYLWGRWNCLETTVI